MENIAIFLAVFAISFFTITSVGSNRVIETYSKLNDFNSLASLNGGTAQSASVMSSLYKPAGDLSKENGSKNFKIKSIDKTEGEDVNQNGIKTKKISIYLIFENPKLKKEGNDWRMHVRADVVTVDKDGKRVKFLDGLSFQEINNKYSYELDSGAFVFNINVGNEVAGKYTSTFTIKDAFSGKKDEKTVVIEI